MHVQATKNQSLRICNRLLRRLSKAQHTVLCGRISLFLARSVALDDRSGLNIQATVNLTNTTPIEEPEQVHKHDLDYQVLAACSTRVQGSQLAAGSAYETGCCHLKLSRIIHAVALARQLTGHGIALPCDCCKRLCSCAASLNVIDLHFVMDQVTVDSNGDPVDVEFYRAFWGLQRTFQAPSANMAPAPWSSAVKTMQAVFKRFKQEGVAVAGSSVPSTGASAL